MKHPSPLRAAPSSGGLSRFLKLSLVPLGLIASPAQAHASMFHGETVDAIANGIAWVALIIAPIVGITVFLMIHVLPEKIAHKKEHPQLGGIKCLCLLSLVFGGLLWPIAWLWAYTKPVMHKMAYGTDKDESHSHGDAKEDDTHEEVGRLRARINELEAKLKNRKGKA